MLRLEDRSQIITDRSDYLGMFASGLCLIHCLATPFLFIAKTCSATCCEETPVWWKTIDVLFLTISFFAVLASTKKSTNKTIQVLMWLAWMAISFVILNEYLNLITLFDKAIYIPAISLIVLHIYNLKFCQCKEKCC